MIRRMYLPAMITLLVTFGVIGIVATADADFNGLGGRSFQVDVRELPNGPWEPNCYTFEADGTWIDPKFLGPTPETGLFPGTWVKNNGGAASRYTASATADLSDPGGPFVLLLIQNGAATPAFSNGTARLTARSTLYINGDPVLDFVSRGNEVDECPPPPPT